MSDNERAAERVAMLRVGRAIWGGGSDNGWAETRELFNAAPALLDLAEAAIAYIRRQPKNWWEHGEMSHCLGCEEARLAMIDRIVRFTDHADDCPAIALDRAIAALGGAKE